MPRPRADALSPSAEPPAERPGAAAPRGSRTPLGASVPAIRVVDAAAGEPALVKSATRTLAVLECFDDVRREMRVGEIAARLGYPQSSVSYLLRSLAKTGYLDYDPQSRTFLPTPRVALLGSWISGEAVSDGPLLRLVGAIAERTRLTVTLGVRNGIYAQYIHVRETRSGFPIHIPTGTSRLLVWSAAGFALLVGEDDRTIRTLVRRANAEIPNLPEPIRAEAVLGHVETVRRQGYFLSDGLVTKGGGHIAMKLPARATGGRRMVIGVAGADDVIRRDAAAIVAIMREAIEAAYRAADAETDQGRTEDR